MGHQSLVEMKYIYVSIQVNLAQSDNWETILKAKVDTGA